MNQQLDDLDIVTELIQHQPKHLRNPHLFMPRQAHHFLWFKKWIVYNDLRRTRSQATRVWNQKRCMAPIRFWPRGARVEGEDQDLFIGDIKMFWKTCLHEDLPFKLELGRHGIGIISKTNDYNLLKDALPGMAHTCTELLQMGTNHLSSQLRLGHSKSAVSALLWGPMSFLNHNCRAHFDFSSNFSTFMDNFDCITTVRLAKCRNRPINIGAEVTVFYAKKQDLWFECEC